MRLVLGTLHQLGINLGTLGVQVGVAYGVGVAWRWAVLGGRGLGGRGL